MNLEELCEAIKKSLEVFFTAKRHNIGCPLRVIVSEEGKFQKSVGVFLQQHLKIHQSKTLFSVKNSEEVAEFFKAKQK